MCKIKMFFALHVMAAVAHSAAGVGPHDSLSRQKRISDQRLAELETLIALSKMKNKMVTIPVGFGRVDPLKVGRRKRSIESLAPRPRASEVIARETEVENQEENAVAEENLTGQIFRGDGPGRKPVSARLPE